MKKKLQIIKKVLVWSLVVLAVAIVLVLIFSIPTISKPSKITYGVSFSKFHSDELGLDWKETYEAILTDLDIKHIRLSAHWPMVEKLEGEFNFTELDYQIRRAKEESANVILVVGRRAPGWPECHVPDWAHDLSVVEQQEKISVYITAVVERYKDESHIDYWQVENEIFLAHFASEICPEINVSFFESEVELVKSIDPDTPVLITDSGEFGSWFSAYKRGDVFGTTMYLYIWSPRWGALKYPVYPGFFFFKQNMVRLVYGDKYLILAELGLEPWLLTPIAEAPIELQMDRMGIDKFKETISFASKTRFDMQYLWGVEWWYWMKKNHDDDRFWEESRLLFD